MEIEERVSMDRLRWLIRMKMSEFQALLRNKEHYTDSEIRDYYTSILDLCRTMIKALGKIKRVYRQTNPECGGRMFSGGSLQGVPNTIRGFLMRDVGTDIDMVNAHVVILLYVCKKHNISCPHLQYYCNNRDICLSKFASRDEGKNAFLKSINSDSLNRNNKHMPIEFVNFDKESKLIQKQIITLPEYKHIVDSVPDNKSFNKTGSALNRILCYYENEILHHAIQVVISKQIEIAILMFDGLMVYGNYYNTPELLDEIEAAVESAMPGLHMKWAYKPHDTTIQITDEELANILSTSSPEKLFDAMATEFEKTHLKIINKSIFIKHTDSQLMYFTRPQLCLSYAHMKYEEEQFTMAGKYKGLISKSFINYWATEYEHIRTKDDVDIYPDPTECPDNIFNLWRPFAMELEKGSYTRKPDALSVILNHIKILCNHDIPVYDYFIKWIAQMIQYPAEKTIMPTFISAEGAGKGTMFRLFEKMLGRDKVFETTNPARDVWGDFNGIMTTCYLVNINELSKRDTVEAEGKIKGLITDNSLTINQKGVAQYKIKSYHRFIATTNKEEPINSTVGDRRNLIIRSSDEKKGDVKYFEYIHGLLEDIDVVRTCYDYFRSIPGMDKFRDIPMPHTEYHDNIKELSRSPIEHWLCDFTREHINEENITLQSTKIYDLFREWCGNNGIKYEIDCVKLNIRLTNMNIQGIFKGPHTRFGKTKIFDINMLRKSLNVGCQL